MSATFSSDFSVSPTQALKACGRAAVTGTLCALLAGQPILAEAAVKKPVATRKATEIEGQERVLHTLNRLTFGPRPGDVAAVEKMGLNKWFEEQLNPAAIDDSALEAKLEAYPAMNLPLAELEKKYPGPNELKALAYGRGQLPTDPTERAMVQFQMESYKIQKKKEAEAAPAAAGAQDMSGAAQGDMAMAAAPAATKKSRRTDQAAAGQAMSGADGGMMAADKPLSAADVAADPMPAKDKDQDREAAHEQAMKLLDLSPDARMHAIMAMSPNQYGRLRQSLGQDGQRLTDGFTAEQKEMLIALPGSIRMVALEETESRMMRDIYSDRQLEAVMTDFWLNHFNVYLRKSQTEPYLIPTYERETIRPRALGNFEDLLVATAKSPAMLVYLDNYKSVGPDSEGASRVKKAKDLAPNAKLLQQASAGLNENYGRELMELHTLGVNGGYTQADVTMVSKVFTGWTLDGGGYKGGQYRFDERRHEPGPKTVLGKTIQENGEQEGLEVLHMLATSPATAHFISTKLAERFVSDNPPAALVDRMAATFLRSNGDVKTVLRTMFNSPEFWSTEAYRAKVKTPEEFVISAVRASGAQVNNPATLVQALDKLGMPLYGMQTPNGYSWKEDGWVSTGALVSRMNFSLILTADRLPGVRMNWTGLLGENPAGVMPASYAVKAGVPADPALAKEKRLENILLGGPVSDRTRATVIGQSNDASVTDQAQTQFDLGGGKGDKRKYAPKSKYGGFDASAGGPDDAQAAVMAGLLLGSPEFQRR